MIYLVSHGLTKALHTQAQMLSVHKELRRLVLNTNTYKKIKFDIFCHLPPRAQSQKKGFWEHY